MAYLLDRINQELGKTGYATGSTRSREWLRKKVNELKPTAQSLMNDRERLRSSTFIGGMYFFYYDPKLKKTLPYYDRFPLVIPIERYSDGFLGLNLHYIHPKQRILLLDALSEYKTNTKYDEKTRLRLSYDLLKRASGIYQVNPCIKRYLFDHIDSRFLEIKANEWDIAALLPVEQFAKATTNKVWNDSRKKF
jgi:hypothetical protein